MVADCPLSPYVQSQLKTIEKMSKEELRAELAKCLRVTAEQLVRSAAIVRRLEDLGDNLEDLKTGMIGYLRKIAYNQLIPDLVVMCQGAPMLMSKVMTLPIPDQQKIVSGEPMRVMELTEKGEETHRLVPPLMLSSEQVRQVFGRECIRNDRQQVLYLRDQKQRFQQVTTDERGIVLDAKRGGIFVNGTFISKTELAQFVAKLT